MTSAPHRAPVRILVLCTGNSARSQIAEALLVRHGGGTLAVTSAGSRPAARVHPRAVEVLAAHGIAWEGRVPRSIDSLHDETFDLVITVCDHARDACPCYPGASAQVHWGLPDPAEEAEPAAARRAFAETYRALDERIRALLALPLGDMTPGALRDAAQRLHDR